jgi:hypothetical protein
LSVRDRVLEILHEVVPSRYGDARFARLAPGYRPDDPRLPPGFTTCGYLPLYVGNRLGVRDGITRGGVEGVRMIGRDHGVWVEAGGSKRPRPGDFLGLSATRGGILTHVDVLVDASGNPWRTADAGQGARDMQEARYVDRIYDPVNVTLGGPAGARPLAGWFDLAAYFGEPEAPEGSALLILLLAAAVAGWLLLEA